MAIVHAENGGPLEHLVSAIPEDDSRVEVPSFDQGIGENFVPYS
jgi:hypothetical protein